MPSILEQIYGREIAAGAEQTRTSGLFQQLALLEGAYEAASLSAEAQRCVNLYMEINPDDAPFPTTHYPTPGLTLFSSPSQSGVGRGLYRANNGELYAVVGNLLYFVDSAGTWNQLTALSSSSGMTAMMDNGAVLVCVDGTANLYVVNLSTHSTTVINQPDVYGATHVGYVDTYFVFNRPGTNQFYISASNLDFTSSSEGPINALSVDTGGSGYYSKTYTDQTLTGGTGFGATADITVSSGVVSAIALKNGGSQYSTGDILSADLATAGPVTGIGIRNAGSFIEDGTYTAYSTNASEGTGLALTVVVAGGNVTSVTIANGGSGYLVGETITLTVFLPSAGVYPAIQPSFKVTSLGGATGSGFTAKVDSIYNTASVNPLDIASKTGYADNILALITVHREIWLLGERTTEIWYDTGAPDFTFGIEEGIFLQTGILAPYSLAKTDIVPFWLGQDFQGNGVIYAGINYQAVRISTHAIETAIQKYSDISDAVGFTYQQRGHWFYVLNFPSGDATWVYDVQSQKWHERASVDSNGDLHRHLPNSAVNCYGKVICQRYDTGDLLYYDLNSFNDLGSEVVRIRSFPHLKNQMRRMSYTDFVADMETGQVTSETAPEISLRWSDDGGYTWSNAIMQSMGATGQYGRYVRWNRLGLGRDRVFELSWSADVQTSLNGGWLDVVPCAT